MDWKKELNTLFPTVMSMGAFTISLLLLMYSSTIQNDNPTAIELAVLSFILFMAGTLKYTG